MNFNTTNSTFRQFLGNGLSYRVPPFQPVNAHYDTWNEHKIEPRQKQMASLAAGIWKIDFGV